MVCSAAPQPEHDLETGYVGADRSDHLFEEDGADRERQAGFDAVAKARARPEQPVVTSERHPGARDNRRDNHWFSIKISSLSLASRPEHEWTPMLLHPCERTLLREPPSLDVASPPQPDETRDEDDHEAD